jgi:hypothetical protein
VEEKPRTSRVKEVCDRFGLEFEIVQAEDDTWILILKGQPASEEFRRAKEQLQGIVGEDWLITLEPPEQS